MTDFLSIGDTHYDTVLQLDRSEVDILVTVASHERKIGLDYASKIPVSNLQAMVGGNAANVAVAGARLHGSTGFWSLLGDDEIADKQMVHFQQEGVNTAWIERIVGATSNQAIVISVDGERTILIYHAPRSYRLAPTLPSVKWVYLTSMSPGSESVYPDLIAHVQRTGGKLAYQPGTYQLRLGLEASKDILEATELLLLNKEEAQLLLGRASGDNPAQLCKALHDTGPKIVVVTDGTNGSWAYDGTNSWHMGIRPHIQRVEATGAGDAFSSGVTLALLEGQPLEEALRWGALNAESVIGKVGPQAGLLTKEKLTAELNRHPNFRPQKL